MPMMPWVRSAVFGRASCLVAISQIATADIAQRTGTPS